jgi:uncharacterized repeat protein (TIGR03803 family)
VVNDGQYPSGGLAFDASGNLYGATGLGGTHMLCGGSAESGCGTVFELKAQTGGGWRYAVLHSFGGTNDGQIPVSVIYHAGKLFGTTGDGGTNGEGTVFELLPPTATITHWTEKLLYTFKGFASNDGAIPTAGLIFDLAGDLWGTTSQGGVGLNNGTVFELTEAAGVWTESIILSFPGSEGVYPDGLNPSGLTYDSSSGNFYCTMSVGGEFGYGTVFELAYNSSGGWTPSVLYSFANEPDGAFPSSGLTVDASGNLYGTTQEGGNFGWGAVFKVAP